VGLLAIAGTDLLMLSVRQRRTNGDVVVWDAKTWKVRHLLSPAEKWPVRELATDLGARGAAQPRAASGASPQCLPR